MSNFVCNFPLPLKTGTAYLYFKQGVSNPWPTRFFAAYGHISTLRIYYKNCPVALAVRQTIDRAW